MEVRVRDISESSGSYSGSSTRTLECTAGETALMEFYPRTSLRGVAAYFVAHDRRGVEIIHKRPGRGVTVSPEAVRVKLSSEDTARAGRFNYKLWITSEDMHEVGSKGTLVIRSNEGR